MVSTHRAIVSRSQPVPRRHIRTHCQYQHTKIRMMVLTTAAALALTRPSVSYAFHQVMAPFLSRSVTTIDPLLVGRRMVPVTSLAATTSTMTTTTTAATTSTTTTAPLPTLRMHPYGWRSSSPSSSCSPPRIFHPTATATTTTTTTTTRSTRRWYARKSHFDEDPKKEGILTSIVEGVKSFLPSRWFQSEEERKAELARKQMKDALTSDLNTALRDAPLPLRMMGRLVAPLFSSAVSSIAEGMEQARMEAEDILKEARATLMADTAVTELLGYGPIEVDDPFSQSSSTASINGKTSSSVQLAFEVHGPLRSGVVRATATNGTIEEMILQVGDRVVTVNLNRRRHANNTLRSKPEHGDDNIIEAEIIEKKTK